jgi:parvulin-like peptidyl-prolyl isomerase
MRRSASVRTLLAALLLVPALAGPVARAAPGPRIAPGTKVIVERVVAIVNDRVILRSELDARLVPVMADAAQIADPKERARRIDKLQGQVLDEMVNEELIVQAAEAAKIEIEASDVQAAVDEIKKQNSLDDAALGQALAAQGYTLANYKSDLRRQLLRIRAVNQLVRPKVQVTDEDLRARYDQMQRRADAVSAVRVAHLQFDLPEHPTEQQLAVAKERAAKAIARVRGGEAFAAVAATDSDDANTKNTGGELGWFERGSMQADWEQVVFAMEKGDVRGPVTGAKGLEVFQVLEVKKSEVKPFEQMKDQLKGQVTQREMEKQTQTWLEELRKKAYIDIKVDR